MSRRDPLTLTDYLKHICDTIGRIQRYLDDTSYSAFLDNSEKQDAVIRNMEIIGEAAGKILRQFPDFATLHAEIPFKAAYSTRNALSHGYFEIDLTVLWQTIERDLPALEQDVRDVLMRLQQTTHPPDS